MNEGIRSIVPSLFSAIRPSFVCHSSTVRLPFIFCSSVFVCCSSAVRLSAVHLAVIAPCISADAVVVDQAVQDVMTRGTDLYDVWLQMCPSQRYFQKSGFFITSLAHFVELLCHWGVMGGPHFNGFGDIPWFWLLQATTACWPWFLQLMRLYSYLSFPINIKHFKLCDLGTPDTEIARFGDHENGAGLVFVPSQKSS